MFAHKAVPLSIAVVALFIFCSVGTAAEYTVIHLWSGGNSLAMIANGEVVWSGRNASDYEIFLYDGTSKTQLTNNADDDRTPHINDHGHVVWSGWDGSDYEIFLYDGTSTTQLTDNDYNDRHPRINDSGYVVWQGGYEIFLYDGTSTTQLTDNDYDDVVPQINDSGYVVWQGGYEIFLYDGTSTTQLTDNDYDDIVPQINDNGYVVWYGCDTADCTVSGDGDAEVFLYDGTSTIQLTNNDYPDVSPQINNSGWVVWKGCDTVLQACNYQGGGDWEILLYDGTSTTQITDNAYNDYDPQINSDGTVVWYGDDGTGYEIYHHDGTTTAQLTNNAYFDRYVQINDEGWVAWQRWNGSNYEILLAIPCSSDNDNDDDGYISASCGGDDCADGNPGINPGMMEIVGNRRDDDCNPATPAYPEPANTIATWYGRTSLIGSGVFNEVALLFLPVGAIILLRILRKKR